MSSLRTLFVFLSLVGLSQAAELTTLDGKKSTGDIVSIDDKQLVLKTATSEETHELTKIASVDFTAGAKDPAPGTKWIEVELIDGSHFQCADFKITGKRALLTLLGTKQTIELPTARILYMIRDIADPKLNQAFRGMLSKRGKRDIWIILKNENLDGVPGSFGDGDDKGESVNFEIEANSEKVMIQLSRVYGMILNQPPDGEVAQTICRVVDAHKNVLFAKSLTLTSKNGLLVETVTGVKAEYPSLAGIGKLDFSAGAMRYLSDLVPSKLELTSTEGIPEPYRRDRNLDNEDLKIAGQKYAKGIALHSRTVLSYSLEGQYKLFEAIVGVDDCVEGESESTLLIEADFKPIFNGVIKKGDKPKMLNLAVLNVKELRITVESKFLDLGNQVDLAMAKVRK